MTHQNDLTTPRRFRHRLNIFSESPHGILQTCHTRVAVSCKVKGDEAISFREVRQLSAPVAGIATPTMHEHKRVLADSVDLIGDRRTIFGKDHVRPFRIRWFRR